MALNGLFDLDGCLVLTVSCNYLLRRWGLWDGDTLEA